MSLPLGLAFEHPTAQADDPHYVSYATARTVADDGVWEVWNGPTNASRVFRINKDGQVQVQVGTLAAPSIVAEADKDTGLNLKSTTPEVELVVAGSEVLSAVAAGVTVTGTLQSTGAATLDSLTVTNASQFSDINVSGTATLAALSISSLTLATLTVTGTATFSGTVAGTPTWSSTQAMNISGNAGTATTAGTVTTAAQPNITSVGTLTGLTVGSSPGGSPTGTVVVQHPSGTAILELRSANDQACEIRFSDAAAAQAAYIFYNHNTDVMSINGDVYLGSTGVGFYGQNPLTKQTVTGSRGGNAALQSLLNRLESLGLITDSTS